MNLNENKKITFIGLQFKNVAKASGRPSNLYTPKCATNWPVPQSKPLLKSTVTYVLLTVLKKSASCSDANIDWSLDD